MNRTFWNLLLVSPAILGLSTVACGSALAVESTTTAVADQLATAQPSESQIAALVTEPVAEPVAAAPAASETVAINSSSAVTEQNSAATTSEPAIAPAIGANSTEAEKLAKIEPDTSAAKLQPVTATATAALPQASDLAVPTSLNPAIENAKLPTSVPAAKVEVAQNAPAQLSNPIVPVAPQAQPTEQSGAMSQVTSVSQLSDVRPTDWAFQALQSLVERYGCIAGYPDGTYRGNRALTRYEFAAGLNACLDQVTKLITSSTSTFVTKDDLGVLQRLQEEFAAELATLRGRVDALEARTAELEANQFSTTTKLRGEVIFTASDTFGDGVALKDDKTSTTFGYRVRLNFDTSFTGKDLLRTRLQAVNIPNYGAATATGTNMARLGVDGDSANAFNLDKVFYRFPVGNATVWLGPRGLNLDDVLPITTPFGDGGNGSISRFGRYNPAIFRGPEGAGAAVNYTFGAAKATVGYLASDGDAPNPANGRGVFDGSFSAVAQLNFSLGKVVDLGLSYNRKYDRSGNVGVTSSTGSSLANRPFGQSATVSNNFGLQANIKPSSRFQLGGWIGYTKAEQENDHKAVNVLNRNREATLLNYAVNLSFPDFGKKGNLLGFVFGMPPKVTDSTFLGTNRRRQEDKDTSYHLEGFYRFQVNDFISVTPGVYVILNPEHNNKNDNIWVGVLRTTFSF
ncbi:iron uptake porin [Microcoleus sp.]|uniref:iron uptake porin n=1 Tax=Microcoleus sp. TaxID=44472 RepID=UPI00352666A8